jgi:proline iminopeptidase
MLRYNGARIHLAVVAAALVAAGCQGETGTVDEVGPSSGVVSAGGLELPCIVRGKGTPLLAVASAAYGSRTFTGPILDHFKIYFVDSRLFLPSDSGFEVETITIESLAQEMDEIRQAFGFETAAVLGHSMFGNFALEYARRYPQRVTHVVVVGCPIIGYSRGFIATQDEYWESHASDERKAILERNWELLTEDSLSKLSPADAKVVRLQANVPGYWYDVTFDPAPMWEGQPQFNLEVLERLDELLHEYDFGQGLGQIETPVFIAMGLYDYIVPYTLWEDELPKLPNATFHLFEKSGHTPQLEEPELFAQKLIEWFENTSPRR